MSPPDQFSLSPDTVNDAPVLTVKVTNNFTEDAAGNGVGSVVATYTTADQEGSAVTVTLSDTTNYALGTGDDAGKVLLTAAGLALVNAGSELPAFTLTPTDGSIDGSAVSVDPSVTAVNDTTITLTDSNTAANSIPENTAMGSEVGITALGTDADSGSTITGYSLTNDAGGRFAINSSTGVVTVAAGLDYETAESHTITVKAVSSDGSEKEERFSIAVTDVTETSTLTIGNLANSNVAENESYTSSAPSITGAIGAVSWSLEGADASLFSVNASTGVVSMVDRNYESPVDDGADNVYNYTLKATDADGNSASQDVAVTVTNVADGATVTISSVVNFTEDASSNAVGSVVATFSSSDANGNPTSVVLSDTINYVLGTGSNSGKVLLTQAGLNLVNAGTDLPAFSLSPYDGTAQSVDPSVTAVNDAPTLTGSPISLPAGTEDTAYTVTQSQLLSGFSDVEGDPLSISGLSAGTAGSISGPDDSGTYTLTPTANFSGELTLSYNVLDGQGGSTAASTKISLANVNDAPTLNQAIPDLKIAEDAAFTITVPTNTFLDPDSGDSLTYSASQGDGSTLPTWPSFDSKSRTFSGTAQQQDGSHPGISLKVTGTDDSNASITDTFTVTISDSTRDYSATTAGLLLDLTGINQASLSGDSTPNVNLNDPSNYNTTTSTFAVTNQTGSSDWQTTWSDGQQIILGNQNDIVVIGSSDLLADSSQLPANIQAGQPIVSYSNFPANLDGGQGSSGLELDLLDYSYFNSGESVLVNLGGIAYGFDLDRNGVIGGDAFNREIYLDHIYAASRIGVSPSTSLSRAIDLVSYAALNQGASNAVLNFEGVIGGRGDDVFVGNDQANLLAGNDGNDFIAGGAGNDTIYGGKGDDLIIPGDGNDIINGGSGVNIIRITSTDLINDKFSLDAQGINILELDGMLNVKFLANSNTIEAATGHALKEGDGIVFNDGDSALNEVVVNVTGDSPIREGITYYVRNPLQGTTGPDTFELSTTAGAFGGTSLQAAATTTYSAYSNTIAITGAYYNPTDLGIDRIDGGDAEAKAIRGDEDSNNFDFGLVSLVNIEEVYAGAGNDIITTAPISKKVNTSYDGGTGSDSVALKFTYDTLASLAQSGDFTRLVQTYVDNPSGSLLRVSFPATAGPSLLSANHQLTIRDTLQFSDRDTNTDELLLDQDGDNSYDPGVDIKEGIDYYIYDADPYAGTFQISAVQGATPIQFAAGINLTNIVGITSAFRSEVAGITARNFEAVSINAVSPALINALQGDPEAVATSTASALRNLTTTAGSDLTLQANAIGTPTAEASSTGDISLALVLPSYSRGLEQVTIDTGGMLQGRINAEQQALASTSTVDDRSQAVVAAYGYGAEDASLTSGRSTDLSIDASVDSRTTAASGGYITQADSTSEAIGALDTSFQAAQSFRLSVDAGVDQITTASNSSGLARSGAASRAYGLIDPDLDLALDGIEAGRDAAIAVTASVRSASTARSTSAQQYGALTIDAATNRLITPLIGAAFPFIITPPDRIRFSHSVGGLIAGRDYYINTIDADAGSFQVSTTPNDAAAIVTLSALNPGETLEIYRPADAIGDAIATVTGIQLDQPSGILAGDTLSLKIATDLDSSSLAQTVDGDAVAGLNRLGGLSDLNSDPLARSIGLEGTAITAGSDSEIDITVSTQADALANTVSGQSQSELNAIISGLTSSPITAGGDLRLRSDADQQLEATATNITGSSRALSGAGAGAAALPSDDSSFARAVAIEASEISAGETLDLQAAASLSLQSQAITSGGERSLEMVISVDSGDYLNAANHRLADGDRVQLQGVAAAGLTPDADYVVRTIRFGAVTPGAANTATPRIAWPTGFSLPNNTPIRIGLASTSPLPSSNQTRHGLTLGATYYVINSSGGTFQLATSPGGSAIALSADTNGNDPLIDVDRFQLASSLDPAAPVIAITSDATLTLVQPAAATAQAGSRELATGLSDPETLRTSSIVGVEGSRTALQSLISGARSAISAYANGLLSAFARNTEGDATAAAGTEAVGLRDTAINAGSGGAVDARASINAVADAVTTGDSPTSDNSLSTLNLSATAIDAAQADHDIRLGANGAVTAAAAIDGSSNAGLTSGNADALASLKATGLRANDAGFTVTIGAVGDLTASARLGSSAAPVVIGALSNAVGDANAQAGAQVSGILGSYIDAPTADFSGIEVGTAQGNIRSTASAYLQTQATTTDGIASVQVGDVNGTGPAMVSGIRNMGLTTGAGVSAIEVSAIGDFQQEARAVKDTASSVANSQVVGILSAVATPLPISYSRNGVIAALADNATISKVISVSGDASSGIQADSLGLGHSAVTIDGSGSLAIRARSSALNLAQSVAGNASA